MLGLKAHSPGKAGHSNPQMRFYVLWAVRLTYELFVVLAAWRRMFCIGTGVPRWQIDAPFLPQLFAK